MPAGAAAPEAVAAPPASAAAPGATAPEPEPEPAAASPLALSWDGPEQIAAGAEAEFALRVNATEPLSSTSFQIAWDPSMLKVVDVSEGDLMNRDGATTSFAPRVDEASGRMFVALSRSAAGGMTGEGTLVSLKVTALSQEGAAAIRLLSFSGIGQVNRMLPTPLPPPHALSVSP
jgi:general secretion pathway protein D